MKLVGTWAEIFVSSQNKIFTQALHLLSLPCFFEMLVIRKIRFICIDKKSERIFYKDVVSHFNQADYPYLYNLLALFHAW